MEWENEGRIRGAREKENRRESRRRG